MNTAHGLRIVQMPRIVDAALLEPSTEVRAHLVRVLARPRVMVRAFFEDELDPQIELIVINLRSASDESLMNSVGRSVKAAVLGYFADDPIEAASRLARAGVRRFGVVPTRSSASDLAANARRLALSNP